jgi:metallophosphoesterase (TIGR00282 family)
MMNSIKILFLGDMVGKGSRKAVRTMVPRLRKQYGCAFAVANGENMAGGGGMTAKCLHELDDAGIDVFTGGDHMWDQRSFVDEISSLSHVLRPANVCADQPGRGYGVYRAANGTPVGVICLQGRTFMNNYADCPFQAADRILAEIEKQTRVIVVDFHAEATSEKIAMGRFLDGRVTMVIGTHTHVPTADTQIFPGGTAYQTDVGMVGARESVLGREIEPVLQRFTTGMPARFTVAETGIQICAVMVEADTDSGRAKMIQPLHLDAD